MARGMVPIEVTSADLVTFVCLAVQVVYGLILGLVGCFICSLTRIWNNGFKRAAAVLFCGLAIMWLGLKLSYLGASSVGCLSLAVMVSTAWERGFPPRISKGDTNSQQESHAVGFCCCSTTCHHLAPRQTLLLLPTTLVAFCMCSGQLVAFKQCELCAACRCSQVLSKGLRQQADSVVDHPGAALAVWRYWN